jgi:uroporphyrinogen-III synthase
MDEYGGDDRRWLLYARGEDVSTDLVAALRATPGDSVMLCPLILYRTHPVPALPSTARERLLDGTVDGVLLMSAKTARTWCALLADAAAKGAAQEALGIAHYCLSQGVADALGELNPHRIMVAERPDLEHIIQLVNRDAAQSAKVSAWPGA